MSEPILSRGRKAFFAGATVLLLLGLGELIARLAGVPDPRFAHGQRIFRAAWLDGAESDAIMMGDPDLFWRLRPGLHGRPWRKPLWIDTRTNALGLRSPEITCPKPAGTFRVLCLGDSCTYGSGVRLGESYPARLEQTFNMVYEEGLYEVVNAGVPGYSSFQGLQFLRREIDRIEPDVLTIAFFHNDAGNWTGLSDEQLYERFHDAQNALFSSALVRALAAPLLNRRSEDLALAREAESVRPRRTEAGVSPVDEGAVSPPANQNPADENPAARRATPEMFARHLVEIVKLARGHGATPVLIVLPLKGQIDGTWPHVSPYQEAIERVAADLDVPLLDVREVLRGRADLFIDNCHFEEQGCLKVARSLFGLLQSGGLLPAPPTLEERRAIRMARLSGDR